MEQINLKQEFEVNFNEYQYAVNTDRAIPDARSGLKPVAERIIYGSFATGRTSKKPYVKCARIVGDVMGTWHPHGDSSIYGALVRLAQPWVMRYPLMDFHGNMGNVDGDGPAAHRYTEARLAKISEQGLLDGIKKNAIEFRPNYDNTDKEPVTLMSIFPNLLCNPNTGIGVAMACNWAPHNLGEVAQAIFDYLDGKEPMLPGPDFPTGGLIINKNDIPNIMKTGHGSVKIRGRYKIEKQNIVFYEIPYEVKTEDLLKNIGDACEKGDVEGVSDIRNESNKKGMRIVIECEKGYEPENVVKKLFLKTKLQSSFSYNQVALVDKTPTEMNLVDCIKIYIKHNIECLINEWNFDLKKAEERLHIVEGLLIALEDIDNVIALIKKSENSSAAKDALMEKYKLDEVQAKAILAMRLSSLAHMEKIELENEKKELVDFIGDLKDALTSPERQKNEVRVRLQNIVTKFGDKRRTELAQIEVPKEDKEIEEVIPEDVVVVMTQSGYVKRIPKKSFKTQNKNGKGIKNADSAILGVISTNTIDNLLVFSNKGKMYKVLVDNIPVGTNAAKGSSIHTLINMENDEKAIAITSLNRKSDKKYVIFVTKNGLVKKTLLEEYTSVKRSTGIAAIKIKDGDSIANVMFANEENMVIVTKGGYAIHFETKDIAPIGRVTSGVKGIKLSEGDEVIAGIPIIDSESCIGIFTSNGMGKKIPVEELPVQGRGGKGVIVYKTTDNVNVVAATTLTDTDNILITGDPNSICVTASDVPKLGRIALGNIMIKGSTVKSVIKL